MSASINRTLAHKQTKWRQRYACDTQSRILYKKLVQVDLYEKLDCVSCILVQFFSCTRILHQTEQSCVRCKKLADLWPKL